MKDDFYLPIPHLDVNRFYKKYPCGNQNELFLYNDVKPEELDSYVAKLLTKGYTVKERLTVGGNSFVTLLSSESLVHLTFSEKKKALKVIFDPLCETVYKPAEAPYQKCASTTLSPISLDYSHREITDGNGLSLVITLEDGRFIIIDGGYGDYPTESGLKEPKDADILYEYLKKSNGRSDKKITVAAWIITHPHADHCGAFKKFTRLYSDKISVEYFVYNCGEAETYSKQYPTNDFLRKEIQEIIKSSYPCAKIIKPHVGQTLAFCDVEFKVLHTHEACIPDIEPATNDTSLVLKMTVNGVKTLLMADCDEGISSLLVDTFGDFLKSDIMQINHHGYSGATTELYDSVLPSYTIWPTSYDAFRLRVTGEKYKYVGSAVKSNKYIYDRLGEDGCIVCDKEEKAISFDGGHVKITRF